MIGTGPYLFVESNTTGTGRLFIEAAAEGGWEPLLLSTEPDRYSFLDELMIRRIRVDTADLDAVTTELASLALPVAVFSSSDRGVETASWIAHRLGLFGPDPNSVRTCRDKAQLYAVLTAAGLDTPKTFATETQEALEVAVDRLGTPVVVKPIAGTGSIGVRLCHDRNEATEHFYSIGQSSDDEGVLVQEFVQGSEHSVECIGIGDEIIPLSTVDKYLGDPPFFVEMAHDIPSSLPQLQIAGLEATAKEALVAVGLRAGGAHVELRIAGDRIVVIEINPRPAGGMIPVLIEQAFGIPVVRNLVALHAGQTPDWQRCKHHTTSIGFFVPANSGIFRSLDCVEAVRSRPGIIEVAAYRNRGDPVGLSGDFSDRVGHVIVTSPNATDARRLRDEALATLRPDILPLEGADRSFQLRSTVLEIAQPIPNPAEARLDLDRLFDIEEAHCLCLRDAGLLAGDDVAAIFAALTAQRRRHFEDVLARSMDRGLYLAYEGWLIDLLGEEIGGSVHAGRSRNDINATLAMLEVRVWTSTLLQRIWRLRRVLLDRAIDQASTPFIMFSQYQPGLPSLAGHYFQALEQALARSASLLLDVFELVDVCPMGAAAGGGTTLPIDPKVTASYLGFASSAGNALDTVANRDAVLHLLGTGATLGVTISRIAQDLQIWSTPPYGLVSIADDLVGGSSIMPQKRNPYLLELAKAKASQIGGALQMSLAAMAKTPFSNSLEVGTVGLTPAEPAVDALIDALTLMTEIMASLRIHPDRVATMVGAGGILSTALAESRVLRGETPFRRAHKDAARRLREEGVPQSDLAPEDLVTWAKRFAHGGGPGEAQLLKEAQDRLAADSDRLRARISQWQRANQARRNALIELQKSALQEEIK